MPGSAPATTSPQAIAEPKLLMGYEKARLGLETQRSQTEGGDTYLDSRNRRLEILGALSNDRVKST